jgi:methanogenic corrinoid protein MtbC1
MIAQLENTIINLDIERAVATTITLQKSQQVTTENIFQAIARALDVVGKKYEQKEYFLTELVMAGEVVKEILILIESPDETPISDRLTKVVLASVRGDLHDIGKNIFTMLLQAQGFHVIDLGIDVPPSEIVSAVKKEHPKILGLSAQFETRSKLLLEELQLTNQLSTNTELMDGGRQSLMELNCVSNGHKRRNLNESSGTI